VAEWVKAVLLGIVEGITEFLPISSTGHLLIASALLDFRGSARGTFEIFIQLGAVLAVIFFYRAELLHQVRTVTTEPGVRRLWLNIVIAFIPAGAVGFLLSRWISDNLVNSPSRAYIIAGALIVGGVIFLVVERRPAPAPTATASLSSMTVRQALAAGLAQTTALIPGVSRSGASIVGGMLAGLSREAATQFSFYLAIPTLGIATVFDLLKNLDQISASDWLYLLLGTLVSAVVAWLSIGWLLRYVSRNSFAPFGYYRIAAGLLILALIVARLLSP